MSGHPADAIARAVLYEGYALYPYRPSALKNRHRFTFGVLYPESYCGGGAGGDRWHLQAECPVEGPADARVDVSVRFLQLVERPPRDASRGAGQQAIERQVHLAPATLADLAGEGAWQKFACDAFSAEPAAAPVDTAIRGEARASARAAGSDVWKLTVSVTNLAWINANATREEALQRSLVSAHVAFDVSGGALVSLLDPPEALREVAASCANVGVWPVLVGDEGSRACMLASPIILYDYPQVAPESAGDLFDATEIDEILALRILTMTDEEKREARQSDERVRELLDRTEALPPEAWARLHGAVRGLRKSTREEP